jgi:hypothetical protein
MSFSLERSVEISKSLSLSRLRGAIDAQVRGPSRSIMGGLPNRRCSGAAWRGDQGDRELNARLRLGAPAHLAAR